MATIITRADLRAARLAAGLSQSTAARLVEVSTSTYTRWETGRGKINRAGGRLFLQRTDEIIKTLQRIFK